MATIEQFLSEAVDKITEAAAKSENASGIMRQVAHGDDSTTVETESGPLPSIAKWFADNTDMVVQLANLAALVYQDTAAGLAATIEGGFFNVISESEIESVILYRHDAGEVATEISRYPSAEVAHAAATAAALAIPAAAEAVEKTGEAVLAAQLAELWAESEEEVEPGRFSAKYWAGLAEAVVTGGMINDDLTSLVTTWSSQKIDSLLDESAQALTDHKSSDDHDERYSRLSTLTTTAVDKTLAPREFCEATEPGLTITLPPSPSTGDEVKIGVGEFDNTVVARNGSNVMGAAEDFVIDRAFVAVTFTYFNSSIGWRIS